jgi:hypothetical protein
MDDELLDLDRRAKALSDRIDHDKRHGRSNKQLEPLRAQLTALELQMQAHIRCTPAVDPARKSRR